MKRKPRNKQALDNQMVGKVFGRLTVTDLVWVTSAIKRRRYAQCRCSCGGGRIVDIYLLERGDTKSCGCLRIEVTRNRSTKDLTGRRFGRLTAMKSSPRGKKIYWDCSCDCGKNTSVPTDKLISGETKSCGCISRATGSNHFNWNPAISNEDRMNKRGTVKNPRYETWRKAVYEKDGYRCSVTGQTGSIVAHHLYAWNRYPDKRYLVENGTTLHSEVHNLFHQMYGKGDNTPEQFDAFKAQYLDGQLGRSILTCASCEA